MTPAQLFAAIVGAFLGFLASVVTTRGNVYGHLVNRTNNLETAKDNMQNQLNDVIARLSKAEAELTVKGAAYDSLQLSYADLSLKYDDLLHRSEQKDVRISELETRVDELTQIERDCVDKLKLQEAQNQAFLAENVPARRETLERLGPLLSDTEATGE